jgi:hypothetical protein
VQNVPAGQGDRRREVGRESINTKYPRVTTKIQGGHRREVGREGGREGRREARDREGDSRGGRMGREKVN